MAKAIVESMPSLATTEIWAPTSAVPLIDVVAALSELIGSVTALIVRDGSTVSLVEVVVVSAKLPTASVAVTVKVSSPSASIETSMLLIDQLPSPLTVVVNVPGQVAAAVADHDRDHGVDLAGAEYQRGKLSVGVDRVGRGVDGHDRRGGVLAGRFAVVGDVAGRVAWRVAVKVIVPSSRVPTVDDDRPGAAGAHGGHDGVRRGFAVCWPRPKSWLPPRPCR